MAIPNRTVAAALVLIAAQLPAQQQDRRPTSRPSVGAQAKRQAHSFRRLELPGAEVAEGVERLETLRWYKTLGAALKAGRETRRPVLWIQALGDLDGFL